MARNQGSHAVSDKTKTMARLPARTVMQFLVSGSDQTLTSLAVNIRSSYIFANPHVVFCPIVFTKANEITHLFGYRENMIAFIYQRAFPLLVNSLLSTSLLDGPLNSETKALLTMLLSYALVQAMTLILRDNVIV